MQPHRPHRAVHRGADRFRTRARRRRHHRPQPRRSRPRHGAPARGGHRDTIGPCETEARRLNEGFARWSQHRRPLVLMKVAMTLDGRIAPPPGQHIQHEPFWITSEAARAAVQPLRWQADAALTGVDTVLADDPLLTDRSGLRRRRPLLRIVLDSALRMPLDCKMVATAHDDVVVFTVSTDQARIRELTSRGIRVEVLPAEAGRVPLGKVLDKLGEEGILTLLDRDRHAPQHRPAGRRPGGPRSPLRLAADHGLRRCSRIPRHGSGHPHGRGRGRALRQRSRALLATARSLAGRARAVTARPAKLRDKPRRPPRTVRIDFSAVLPRSEWAILNPRKSGEDRIRRVLSPAPRSRQDFDRKSQAFPQGSRKSLRVAVKADEDEMLANCGWI